MLRCFFQNPSGYPPLLSLQGAYEESEQLRRQTLEIVRRTLGDEHPSTLNSIGNMGALLIRQGKLDEAEPIPMSGEVRWHRTEEDGSATGCGVRFKDLESNVVAVLDRALRSLPKEPLLYDV